MAAVAENTKLQAENAELRGRLGAYERVFAEVRRQESVLGKPHVKVNAVLKMARKAGWED